MEIVRKRNEGEPLLLPNGEPIIHLEGKLGAIVQFPVLVDEGEGYVQKMFERFVRPPGTRILAIKDEKIYFQKERRLETANGFDWRLPGGKVVDRFSEYKEYLNKEIPEKVVLEAAQRELFEEAGLKAENMTIYKKSVCGASVTWDLFYILAEGIQEGKRKEVEAEEIVEGKWFTKKEIKDLISKEEIDEDRTVGILLRYLES
jgi:8-oxo-dGTP pyrophosphatase MutT (NUDIX family)